MKLIISSVGIVILIFPVVRHLSFERRANRVETESEIIGLFTSIPAGLMQGFVALMILGFLCDGGKGYKPLWLLTLMLVAGALWIVIYPSGWLLGIPLILYSVEKLYRVAARKTKRANNH